MVWAVARGREKAEATKGEDRGEDAGPGVVEAVGDEEIGMGLEEVEETVMVNDGQ